MRSLVSLSLLLTSAALVLAGGATPRREDVPKYLNMLLKSTKAKERAHGAEMLGKRGAINRKDVEEAVDPLKTALQKDVDSSVRAAAARALGNIAPEPKETVPLLIDALKDKSIDVKIATMTALGQYGPEAKAAVTSLREIQKDKDDKKLSQAAGAALKSILAKMK
jgi:HEAT repeat protein